MSLLVENLDELVENERVASTLWFCHFGRRRRRGRRRARGPGRARARRPAALRAVGYLVPMTDGEKKKEIERYEAQMAGKRPPNQSSESDFFPIYGTDIRRGTTEQWRSALGIPWMTREQLREAIPPAYSRHLGKQVIANMKR